MASSLPDPHAVLGHRHAGRPIFPILGASPDDPLNDEATVSLRSHPHSVRGYFGGPHVGYVLDENPMSF